MTRNGVTQHSRSSSFLLLTENEAPQDSRCSRQENIEARSFVRKGFFTGPINWYPLILLNENIIACCSQFPNHLNCYLLFIRKKSNLSIVSFGRHILLASWNSFLYSVHQSQDISNPPSLSCNRSRIFISPSDNSRIVAVIKSSNIPAKKSEGAGTCSLPYLEVSLQIDVSILLMIISLNSFKSITSSIP